MDNRFAEMVRAVRVQLEDGGLQPHDDVLILSSTDNYSPLVEAYVSAVASMGAEPTLLRYPAPPPLQGLSDFIVDTASRAKLVIDLNFKSWAYTESQDRYIRQRQAPPLSAGLVLGQTYGWEEDVFHLIKLTPDADVKERSKRARVLFDKAQTIKLTSSLGTDLVVKRGDPDRHLSRDIPGIVACFPPDDAADGVLFYQGGFRTQFPSVIRRMVHEPIRMEVQKGKLVHIARDTEAGIMLDDWFRSHNDPNSYHFAEIALGLDNRVELHRLDNAAVHFAYGVMIGFGTNYWPSRGTGVKAKSHIDMMHTGGEYWLDDLCLMRDAEFTEESGLRSLALA